MSTPNFKFNCNSVFPMMVMSNYDLCEFILGKDDKNRFSNADFDFACDIFYYHGYTDDLEEEFENLNLKWYNLKLESGYYEGIQILVDTEWCNIGEWSDNDCLDEFGLNKKETIQMILKEQEKICKYLKSKTDYGFKEIKCDGIFSNGEAVYHYVDTE